MCSFLIYNIIIASVLLDKINKFLKLRGPDHTNIHNYKDFTFVHNLLHITGDLTMQPFIHENIICLYNGEIYNYKSFNTYYKSDGECLIPLYLQYGNQFPKYLHGEFAICLFDFDKNIFILSSDIFRTKPLYYGINNDRLCIASWPLPIKQLDFIDIKKIDCNTILTFNIDTLKLINTDTLYTFNLIQYKTSFDDFIVALKNSIKMRYHENSEEVFITLSSGYDSGVIACELNLLNKKCNYISLKSPLENISTIYSRFFLNQSGKKTMIKRNKNINNFKYIYDLYRMNFNDSIDNSPYYLASILLYSESHTNKYKVNLSGHGVDEIMSDYYGSSTSNFKGIFPNDLSNIFPKYPSDENCKWTNFYNNINMINIKRDEFVASIFGIETRYPFLDKYVVQEFLNLSVDLKNSIYKAPLNHYLEMYNYPFNKGKKAGLWINI